MRRRVRDFSSHCNGNDGKSECSCDGNGEGVCTRTSCNGEIEIFQNGNEENSLSISQLENGAENGHVSENESVNSTSSRSSLSSDRTRKTNSSDHVIETSTDTLTEDDNSKLTKDSNKLEMCENGHTENSPLAKI